MACPFPTIPEISQNECIGNSLTKINSYFTQLYTNACANYNTIENLQSGINYLTTQLDILSGYVVPGVTKAWVKFNGTLNEAGALSPTSNTPRFIYSSYNITNVERYGAGLYQITYQTPFPNTNYLLIGTSSQKQASTGLFTWLQPVDIRTNFAVVRVMGINANSVADPEHVSVVFY